MAAWNIIGNHICWLGCFTNLADCLNVLSCRLVPDPSVWSLLFSATGQISLLATFNVLISKWWLGNMLGLREDTILHNCRFRRRLM